MELQIQLKFEVYKNNSDVHILWLNLIFVGTNFCDGGKKSFKRKPKCDSKTNVA